MFNETPEFKDLLFWMRVFSIAGPTCVVAAVTWCCLTSKAIGHIRRRAERALKILEKPHDHGLGTKGIIEATKENTRTIKAGARTLRWWMNRKSGEEIPPFGDEE